MRSRLLAFRRTAAIAAVWAVAMGGLIATSSSAGSQEGTAVEPGLGSAFAQGYKVDPRSGRLSFGITYGLALAGHQNEVAVAEARSLDLGLIGSTLARETCDGGDPTLPQEDQPQPLVVRSTEEGSADGAAETENAVEKRARASDKPFAQAVAVTAASGDPAVLQIGSTVSRTTSGIVDGTRRAVAVTEVADITLAGGAVVLEGLRWEAVYQSAPAEKVTGSFTMEGIEMAGAPIPFSDVTDALAEVNTLLEPLGFFIDAPQVRNESGISFVDPLRIGIEPSQTRDGVIAPILSAVQPVRESVFDALIEADCSTAAAITIGDVVLGAITGAGSLNVEVGGVTASSGEIQGTSLLGGSRSLGPSLSPLPPPSPSVGGDSFSPGGGDGGFSAPSAVGDGSSGPTTETTTADNVPVSSDEDESALPAIQEASGTRGGPLVWVGLGGLALLAALAELDRRKMRRAQRSVPMEVLA